MAAGIVIVDYGMGNLHSVKRKLYRIKAEATISSDPKVIETADKIILPGVGHFGRAMQNLKERGLVDSLNEMILVRKKPVLGICLGMQLMASRSEEGNAQGLGWIDAEVVKFSVSDSSWYKIPHMGWNTISQLKSSELNKGLNEKTEFYFVHSYHIKCNNPADALHETEYDYRFTSAIERDNIFGVQYHPEKSHDGGETLLKNFISI